MGGGEVASPGFRLESEDGLRTLVVTGPWSEGAAAALDGGLADVLVLNYALGFKDTDLSFVKDWPLKEIRLLARTCRDLQPLSRCRDLRSLSVQASTVAPLDLAWFPSLVDLSAAWSAVRSTIAAGPRLETMYLGGYDEHDLVPLAHHDSLRDLRFKDRPRLRSLRGLGAMPRMDHLAVSGASALTDIDELTLVPQLHRLRLEACRGIDRLDPLAALQDLQFLDASENGDLDSLAPLAGLASIEGLWIHSSTNIVDGDLTPLLALRHLRDLRLKSRSHYVPSVDEIQALLAGPRSD